MFCERCGKQIEEALNFCNACGAQLKKDGDERESVLNSLITALIIIAAAGLGVLVGLTALLLDKSPNIEPIFLFAVIYLGVLFGICFMVMRQISKMIDAKLASDRPAKGTRRETIDPIVQLPSKKTAQLEQQSFEPASVTEHTTRTLEGVPVVRDR